MDKCDATTNRASPKDMTDEDISIKYAQMKIWCSPQRFANTIKSLSPKHKKAIQLNTSLGGLTNMHPTFLRRTMLVELAKRYNNDTQSISIGGNDIPITPTDVYQTLGLPIEGEDISIRLKKEKRHQNLLAAYGDADGKLRLAHLEAQIKASTKPDHHFLRQIHLFALGTMIAPTSKDYVDPCYLNLVENVEDLPKFNWGCYTLAHLLNSMRNFNEFDQICLQGNLVLLQCWYWEHVRAGSVTYSTIPPPLIARWTEEYAKLRTEAYDKGDLDTGVVTINICDSNGPTNVTNVHATNKQRHADEEVSSQTQPRAQTMSSQEMDDIIQRVDMRISELEKKTARQQLDLEHKLDAKLLTINEALIDIRISLGSKPRLSKVEDELRLVTREIKEMRSLLQTNTQALSSDAYAHVQEQVTRVADTFPPTPRCDASAEMFGDTTAGPTSAEQVLQNKHLDKLTPPRKTIFDDDYNLTEEDLELALFIRGSYDHAVVAQIEDHVLTAQHLKPNVDGGFYFDQVINAYALISMEESATTSFLTTTDSRKLLGECGPFPRGSENPWVARIANKIVGRRTVRIPLNVHDVHWHLLVLNFDKEELQVLNSSQGYRDEDKETALVNSIQSCINDAVNGGLVTVTKPIDITKWKTKNYTNIPQQKDSHSCGAYTLKYMLSWDGEEMTEKFSQAQINIFSYKVCSRLLRSNCNLIRKESYTKPITEEEHKASIAEIPEGPEDDLTEIPDPNVTNKPVQVHEKPKRKRGRPKKVTEPTEQNSVKNKFATEAIAAQVQGKRKRKKSHVKMDPFQSP
ncbi:unnamed protein product [Alopecurus aequalis]